jgi:protein TonB
MQGTRAGNNEPKNVEFRMALGRCLVEGDPEAASGARRSRRKTFGASLAIELVLLGALVAAPLLTSGAQLQLRKILPPKLTFFGVWREHHPTQNFESPSTARNPEIPTPFFKPEAPLTNVEIHSVDEMSEIPVPDFPGGSGTGASLGTDPRESPLLVEPPHIVPPPPQHEKHTLKISEGVLEAQLISRIEPRYPSLALQTKTEGTVILHAIISREGRITSLDAISGHPLLVRAALEAVRQWRYRPTMLNGEPVEVETSITVIFRLHG